MEKYNISFTVIGLNNEQYQLNKCRIDYKKRIIYTKDLAQYIQCGYKLSRKYTHYDEEFYLVTKVSQKPSLTGTIAIYIMRLDL
ncbi:MULTISPECIES: hypothetical protein [unclassified Acinetobacter]|uniref:hypothetical protein n=1 Tax=unclassified Acinetobacter TaxID=196816 RepID=UPI0029342C7E|nr:MULTISPECIES: hypothetical protein [unclassified Acinetobacter]WOE32199.1 hypothetical protein QSG84_03005 [Acinetobacter sp. SAAs470]WOE37669.1 hypothetical protein QSG86_12050 [Acinetobacter sp. SAAs474]